MTEHIMVNESKSPGKQVISLGKQHENLAVTVQFDVSAWLDAIAPNGVFGVNVRRHGESASYPCPITVDGTVVTMQIRDVETEKDGSGFVELEYRVGDTVVRSATWKTYVQPSITDTTTEPPDPFESWVETLTGLGAQTEQNAESAAGSAEDAERSATTAAQSATDAEAAKTTAEEAADNAETAAERAEAAMLHAPYIDSTNKHWYVYNPTTEVYADTGMVAEGQDGAKGDKGDTGAQGVQGERGLQGEKGDKGDTGAQGEQGISGTDGADGYTPVRGVDYWTSADKSEIVDDVISALPTYNGEVV